MRREREVALPAARRALMARRRRSRPRARRRAAVVQWARPEHRLANGAPALLPRRARWRSWNRASRRTVPTIEREKVVGRARGSGRARLLFLPSSSGARSCVHAPRAELWRSSVVGASAAARGSRHRSGRQTGEAEGSWRSPSLVAPLALAAPVPALPTAPAAARERRLLRTWTCSSHRSPRCSLGALAARACRGARALDARALGARRAHAPSTRATCPRTEHTRMLSRCSHVLSLCPALVRPAGVSTCSHEFEQCKPRVRNRSDLENRGGGSTR